MASKSQHRNSSTDLDPAQIVLLQEAEAKKRRKRDETKIALDKIRARISTTLHGYHDGGNKPGEETELDDDDDIIRRGSSVEVCFENITDPSRLFNLLSDVRIRSKYEKRLTVVVVQMESKHEEKEKVLRSLDDFFQETKASDLEKFIAELDSNDIDFEEATVGIENALATATRAGARLMAIEKEIGQLLALTASYPDTKKGRKKLEKALMKAQEEIQSMSGSLTDMKIELEETKSKCSHLQTSLDTKTTECVKLRKEAQQAKKLQYTNDSMKAELEKVSSALKKTEEELMKFQKKPPPSLVSHVIVDEDKIAQLEETLKESRNAYELIKAEKEQQIERLQDEMKNMKAQYEIEMAEMKAIHKEQLHSLIEEDTEEMDGFSKQGSIDGSADVTNEEANLPIELEAILKSELEKVKSSSRKIITSLKARLAEAQLKLESQEPEQIIDLKNQLTELQQQNKQINELYNRLQLELQTQQAACHKHMARLEELENTLQILSVELQQVSQQQQSADGSPMNSPLLQRLSPHLKDLATRSTQWSDHGDRSRLTCSSPLSLTSSSQPLIQMEDIVHNTRYSSPLSNRSVLLDSSSGSIHVSLANLHHTHGSPLHNGSLVNSRGNGGLPGNAGIVLAAFSNSSKPDSITPDHPIILEWTKAYEQVMRFKQNIVKMLKGSESTLGTEDEVLQDLQNQENLNLDKEKELSGQVTQMRFTLALILHQLEAALESKLTATDTAAEESDTVQLMESNNQERLLQQIAKFKKQARLSEDNYKHEIQKSKERIASLCNKMETLKTELSTAQRQLLESENIEKNRVVFFTRLDSERNKRALEEAIDNDLISDEEYETIVTDMEDYLSLPGQRLQHIKAQVQQQVGLKKTISHVKRHPPPSPEHTSQVLTMIQQLQEKKRIDFSDKMEKISSKRLELANKLQSDLVKVENKSNVFLIKPMYPTKYHGPIVIPLKRSPPSYRASTTSAHSKRVSSSRTSSQHPAMQLITELRSEMNSQQAKELPENYGLSTEQSSCVPTRPTSVGGETQWRLSSSYTPAPDIDFSPVLPRLVELEVTKMRQSQGPLLSTERNRDSLSRSLIRNGTIINSQFQQLRNHATTIASNDGNYGNDGSVLPPIHVPNNLQHQTLLTS